MKVILRSSSQGLKYPYFDHFLDFFNFFLGIGPKLFLDLFFLEKTPELNELERVMTALKISSKNIEKQKS